MLKKSSWKSKRAKILAIAGGLLAVCLIGVIVGAATSALAAGGVHNATLLNDQLYHKKGKPQTKGGTPTPTPTAVATDGTPTPTPTAVTTDPNMTGMDMTGTTTTDPTTTTNGTVTSAVALLTHAPSGTATLSQANGTLTVTLTLTGLKPGGSYAAHIHQGTSCLTTTNGTMIQALNNVKADTAGNGTSVTQINLNNLNGNQPNGNQQSAIPASGWYINVHNGDGADGLKAADTDAAIACGTIKNPNNAAKVTVKLGPSSSPGENAAGFATLTFTQGTQGTPTLSILLLMHGMIPNSEHAAHIHAGSCTQPGEPLIHLDMSNGQMVPLKADGNGNISATITIANPTTLKGTAVTAIPTAGWAINVHYGTDLNSQTQYTPVLCGNVVA